MKGQLAVGCSPDCMICFVYIIYVLIKIVSKYVLKMSLAYAYLHLLKYNGRNKSAYYVTHTRTNYM